MTNTPRRRPGGTKMVTIFDVGRVAGVSRSTVSRVLNGKGEVDPKTAEQVWEAVRRLNYQPNASARALVRQRTDTIGIMLAHVSDPFYENIIKGIESVATKRGMDVVFYNSYDDLAGHRRIITSALETSRVDGLIVVGSHLGDKPILLEMIGRGLPIALIERNFSDLRVPCIVADNRRGAVLAVEHLIKLGHKRIGCITGNLHYQTAIDRLEGYKAALAEHGLPIEEELIAFGNFQHESGYAAMKQLLALPSRPTAVFACNDMMATGALVALSEASLTVPDDMAIVGFDDITLASMVYPQLTTIRQPLYEMGSLAADALIDRIQLGDRAEAVKITLPVELVVRKSSGRQ